ncbi:MAG: Fic/DOC family protein [Mycetocola sp.]
MDSAAASDPYLDPTTGVLINRVGATTATELKRFEADLTTGRTIQMLENGSVARTNDTNELTSIHRHIFQDLFDWAGHIRTIDMSRDGGAFFAPAAGIDLNLDNLFGLLREEHFLTGLDEESFVDRLAVFYDLLNVIHPFREGNGRTQRLLWSRVAFDAGYLLDWRPVHGDLLDEVSRAAREDGDTAGLIDALRLCATPLRDH